MSENCSHNCSSCGETCASRTMESFRVPLNPQSSVKKVIGVVSGKGGVGKSLVTSLMACKMRARNNRVGILDADITGPSLGGYVLSRIKHISFFQYADLVMPSVALAQGFGRIGCFLAGCCYGMPTHSHFAIVFHDSDFAPNNIPLVPTQLISSGLDFLHCLLLLYAAKKCKKQGQVVSLYLICYSLGRFVLEFFRGDLNRGAVGSLSTSQFISLFIFAAGVAMFAFCGKRTEVPLEK